MTSLKTWYGRSIKIPTEFGIRTQAFAANALGIVVSVLREELGKVKIIVKPNSDDTFAERSTLTIVIGGAIFSQDDERRPNPDASVEQAISTAIGLALHEALHFKFSPLTVDEKLHEIGIIEPDALHYALYQRVEDVFIESEAFAEWGPLNWSLEELWQYYFPLEKLEREFLDRRPRTSTELVQMINLITLAKNRSLSIQQYLPAFEYKLIEVLYTADDNPSQLERALIAEKLYDMLHPDLDDETKVELELVRFRGGRETVISDFLIPGLEDLQNEAPELKTKTSSRFDLEKKLAELIEAASAKDFTYEDDVVPTFIKTPPNRFTNDYKIDARYYKLSAAAKQNATVNRPIGQAQSHGSSIERLYRIATDSKIFADPVTLRLPNPLEVIILVDCSGSMEGVIKNALAAAHGAAIGLEAGRNKVLVVGHSADIGVDRADKALDLYILKRFNEPSSKMKPRANEIYVNQEAYLNQNRDGTAVRRVAKMFTTARNSKKLIVISDGAPWAADYGGISAQNDTTKAVDQTRKGGVDVISISITTSAMKVNDMIYGKRKNIRNEDPNVIAQLLTSMLH